MSVVNIPPLGKGVMLRLYAEYPPFTQVAELFVNEIDVNALTVEAVTEPAVMFS